MDATLYQSTAIRSSHAPARLLIGFGTRMIRPRLHGWRRTGLAVRENVDELAERIAHVELPHTPTLIRRSVFDRKPRAFHALERGVHVIDLDRKIGRWRAGT